MQTTVSNRYRYDFLVISLSVIFVSFFSILKIEPISQGFARYFLFICIAGLDITTLIFACRLYFRNDYHPEAKRFFLFLTLSLACILVSNFAYQLSYNLLQLRYSTEPPLLLSTINIPWIGYLMFQLFAWTSVLIRINIFKKVSLYIPLAIITLAILFIFYLVIEMRVWPNQSFLSAFYDASGAIFQISSILAALLCLAISKNKAIFYISLGYLIAITTGIVLNFNILSESYGISSVLESLWPVRAILMIYGMSILFKTGDYRLHPKKWVAEFDSIRTQVSFWILASFLSVLFLLIGIFYLFEGRIFF